MNTGLERRLEQAVERFEELERLLAQPDAASDSRKFADLSREYSELQSIVETWSALQSLDTREAEARALARESDAEMRAMADEELAEVETERARLDRRLRTLILPRDRNDERNLFLEIRAGTGGQEAALFAGDLLRMYSRYAESQGWGIEILSGQSGEVGGWREIIARIVGKGAYSRLKFESGTHRVQRVPETESQGRIHTSACTVAILPEVDAVDAVHVDPNDLRIDTFRSSGPGGQHANVTDSAVRMIHEPTGIEVQCQDESSQHKNRKKAWRVLRSRYQEKIEEKRNEKRESKRRGQIGQGQRSEKIRTYNFRQNRVTDHRINYTTHNIEAIMEGEIDELISRLEEAEKEEMLENQGISELLGSG